MRILAVDDDPTILEITELFLESLGYSDIFVAPSAKHALKLMDRNSEPFDCILLDINMPDMSGIELLPHILGHPVHHDARVVMLSALSDTQHIEDAFVAGAIDYMLKPFELFDLEASIKAVDTKSLAKRPIPVTELKSDQSDILQIGKLIEAGGTLRSDASGVVSPFAIENCIKRVPPSTRDRAGIALLQLDTLATGRNVTGLTVVDPYIKALIQALVEALQGTRSMFSYNGNGVFTILSFGFAGDDHPDLERCMSDAVQAADQQVFSSTQEKTRFHTDLVLCRTSRAGTDPLAALKDHS